MTENEVLIDRLSQAGILTREELLRRLSQLSGRGLELVVGLEKQFPRRRKELGRIWGDTVGVAYVDLDKTLIQGEAASRLPEEVARQHKVIPLYELGGALTVACSNPRDPKLLHELQGITEQLVSLVFSFPDEISDAIDLAYQSRQALLDMIAETGVHQFESEPDSITVERLKALGGQEFIIKFVRGLLLLALHERASDIHIEPREHHVHIRFRIDGVLQERFKLEPALHAPLTSRLKVLAQADITERRRPQDGRIRLELSHRSIDFRFSSVPAICGEKIVLRLLGQLRFREVPDLSELQFSVRIMEGVKRVIATPNGVFFVTGPTGSGKTTTLYAALKHISSSENNILTIEDPVEYRLDGVNQVQVNHEVGFDFSDALRAFLRQDPDVVLVGEIRDVASAKIAAEAALTGHLVLATMHTNNALQAVTRLCEIGVEPFLVAPALIAVMAQRLVRRICEHCKHAYIASSQLLEENFQWDGQAEVSLFRGAGCESCNFTGYLGRLGVHELFVLSDDIRTLVARNASILEIQEAAWRTGFKPLRYDGLKKALRGLTTMEEVDRLAYPGTD